MKSGTRENIALVALLTVLTLGIIFDIINDRYPPDCYQISSESRTDIED